MLKQRIQIDQLRFQPKLSENNTPTNHSSEVRIFFSLFSDQIPHPLSDRSTIENRTINDKISLCQ